MASERGIRSLQDTGHARVAGEHETAWVVSLLAHSKLGRERRSGHGEGSSSGTLHLRHAGHRGWVVFASAVGGAGDCCAVTTGDHLELTVISNNGTSIAAHGHALALLALLSLIEVKHGDHQALRSNWFVRARLDKAEFELSLSSRLHGQQTNVDGLGAKFVVGNTATVVVTNRGHDEIHVHSVLSQRTTIAQLLLAAASAAHVVLHHIVQCKLGPVSESVTARAGRVATVTCGSCADWLRILDCLFILRLCSCLRVASREAVIQLAIVIEVWGIHQAAAFILGSRNCNGRILSSAHPVQAQRFDVVGLQTSASVLRGTHIAVATPTNESTALTSTGASADKQTLVDWDGLRIPFRPPPCSTSDFVAECVSITVLCGDCIGLGHKVHIEVIPVVSSVVAANGPALDKVKHDLAIWVINATSRLINRAPVLIKMIGHNVAMGAVETDLANLTSSLSALAIDKILEGATTIHNDFNDVLSE